MKAILASTLLIPITAPAAVDFVRDVQPILELNCVRCHTAKATEVEKGTTDYILDNAKDAIRGSYIRPGSGEKSKVYKTTVVADDDDDLMPPLTEIQKGSSRKLKKAESDTLKQWIDEGAKWPDGVTLVARKPADERYPNDNAALTAEIHKGIVEFSTEKSEKEMKPYRIGAIGTDVMFDLVPIPGGKFKMGSPENEPGRGKDEGPQKEVTLEPFWMGKTEVTWDEYDLFMFPKEEKILRDLRQLTDTQKKHIANSDEIARPSSPYVEMSFGMDKGNRPAISMTQHAANKYCEWLSARTGHFYRLPTEAEWEYAARAGTTTAYYWGDDASRIDDYAWTYRNAVEGYRQVAKKKPNAWGLYDMIGNVTEWTLDQYDPDFYSKSPSSNPWNVATRPYPHAARGGSFEDEKLEGFRSAARRASNPEWKRQDPQLPKSFWYHTDAKFIGFRVVRPLKVPSAAEMQKYWNSGVERDVLR